MSQFGEYVREFRPSQDDEFAQRVNLLIAVGGGDAARGEQQLAMNPALLEVTLSREDWGRAEMGHPTLLLEFDYTPPLFAANYGQRELAEILLRQGANPNVHLRGETPLGRAVLMHDEAMADLLVRAGADPNAVLVNAMTRFTARPCADRTSPARCRRQSGSTGRVWTHTSRLGNPEWLHGGCRVARRDGLGIAQSGVATASTLRTRDRQQGPWLGR